MLLLVRFTFYYWLNREGVFSGFFSVVTKTFSTVPAGHNSEETEDLFARLQRRSGTLLFLSVSSGKVRRGRRSAPVKYKQWYPWCLQVLLPRVSVELDVKSRKRRDWERIVGDGSHEVKEEIAQVVNGETIEWEEMRKFRERNQARRRCHELSLTKASDLQQRFCVCKRFASPNMIECQLCRDWFHNKCVLSSYCRGLSKAVERTKFLCGSCIRTRRPGLDMVNLMVLNLKKVPVLMPEAIALQRLANRATEWQQRARQALALAQDSLAQSAKETELLVGSKGKKDSSYLKSDVEGSDDCAKLEKDRRSGEPEVDIEAVSPLSASEPAQPVNLREDLRGELEELMFEGDLLEVTLDETQQIWQLLQSGHIKDSCVQPILIGEEVITVTLNHPLLCCNSSLWIVIAS